MSVSFPALGLYLYASTEEILKRALSKVRLPVKRPTKINLGLRGDPSDRRSGKTHPSQFDDSHLGYGWYDPRWRAYAYGGQPKASAPRLTIPQGYLEEIKSVASAFGYSPESIDRLAGMGFSAEELEEYLYCGEL